ncbi:MAG: UbiX family flavin prenyltransferase [Oscillospiraceae bacterium]
MAEKRLIVGVSGASGAPLTVALLQALKETGVETHAVLTRGGELTLRQECGLESLEGLADVVYDVQDIGAGPASGSFKAMGMIVIPCSMKTAAGIHSGYSDNLLLRAADVTLKERRKLVLVAREAPFSTIHLRNLYELSRMGAVILPPMLSYYQRPETVVEMTYHTVCKALDQFGIEAPGFRRWEGML